MARIRTIKPEFPHSESMGRVSRDARLLFILLWPICDDSGKTRGASRMLASLLFPYDDDAPSLIEGWLGELEREGCIVRYQVEGATYLQILNWLNHQKIDRPSKSKFPEFSEDSRIIARPREHSTLDQRTKDQGPPIKENTPKGVQKKSSQKGKTLVPKDWMPGAKLEDWFHDQQFDFTLADMREQYIDGCRSKTLMYADHDAAFRNWSKRRHERQQTNGGGGPGPSRAKRHQDKLREIAERSLAEERAREEEAGRPA